MANAWGELSWNAGNWGDQNNVTEQVTGLGSSIALNSVDSYPNQGWGSDFWGSENWGESTLDVQLTGLGLTVDSGANESWGQAGWNATTTEWGGPSLTDVAIGQQVDVSGRQLNIQNLGDPLVFSATEVFLDQNPLPNLTVAEGTVDPGPDVVLTGIGLTSTTGTLEGYNEEGWGRTYWGEEVWGASGFWAFGNTTGIQINASVGTVDAKPVTIAEPSGIGLTAEEGTVDPSPDATVVGIGLTASVALGSVIEADADVTITGIGLEIAQGQAELDAVTIAEPTGQQLNISLNSAVAGASAEVNLTGNQLTITSGSINVQSWQIVDTGTNVNWNIIDTAA
jgi:hypothetical protein